MMEGLRDYDYDKLDEKKDNNNKNRIMKIRY